MNSSVTSTSLIKTTHQLWRRVVGATLALAFGCLILLPAARTAFGVTPAPDGGYPNGNTAEGFNALLNLDTNQAGGNTAVGSDALVDNISGEENTAVGNVALEANKASQNTAVGSQALELNTTGMANVATGVAALVSNKSASENTATGFEALFSNTIGPINTATGAYALFSNTIGQSNVATGVDALYHNQAGHDNTADGYLALLNSKGSNNTGLGSNAGASLTTGNNNIDIGANVLGNAGEANTIRIGKQGTQQKTIVAGIYGKTIPSGVGVIINSQGQLGTVQSSARFKGDIKPMDNASAALLNLRPVTFRYKQEIDPDKIPQFGLIAEEVEKVSPDLVVRDEDGKAMTVRYEAVNAMLLNEFLKEHRKVEEQERRAVEQDRKMREEEVTIAQQQQEIKALTAGFKEQAARIQEVTAQLELSEPASRAASNSQ